MQQYLTAVPDSVAAANLRACNAHRLAGGAAAAADLAAFRQSTKARVLEHALLRHNAVVFAGGADAPKCGAAAMLPLCFTDRGLDLCVHLTAGFVTTH